MYYTLLLLKNSSHNPLRKIEPNPHDSEGLSRRLYEILLDQDDIWRRLKFHLLMRAFPHLYTKVEK